MEFKIFNIDDHLIDIRKGAKAIVVEERKYITSVDTTRQSIKIKLEDEDRIPEIWFPSDYFELDVQYYREEKLRKLLD